MNCERSKLAMADYWAATMEERARVEFEVHLSECGECRAEAEELAGMWRALGLLPDAEGLEPSRAMRPRFYQALGAYQVGLADSRKAAPPSLGERLKAWWRQPALQFATVGAVLVMGVTAGWLARSPAVKQEDSELAQLRKEVGGMRQLVALSLMQQQSASERLRGVSWSYRVDQSDTEVLGALLAAVNQDPSTNVRLAAVDALRPFASSPVTRRAIVQALNRQDSPLVQVALIDLIVEIKEGSAKQALESLAGQEAANPSVKERARKALLQL